MAFKNALRAVMAGLLVETADIEANAVTTAKLSKDTIQVAEVALTNAQIKALRATPVTLIAAPGAGKVIEVTGWQIILDAGTNALTESAANLDVRYAGATAIGTTETTGFIDQTTDQWIYGRPANDKLVTKANCENKAVELFNNGAAEFGGNAAADALLRVKIAYRIWSTGW